MSRQRPCVAGDVVKVRSPHTGDVDTMTVSEVRWDKWLFGGSFRVFGRVAGETRDRLYYSAKDLIEVPGRLF